MLSMKRWMAAGVGVAALAAAAAAQPETLSLNPAASSCYPTGTVTVHVNMTNATNTIVGGQFFLEYDTTKLTFVSAAPGGGVFNTEIFESVNPGAGPGVGTIDYAVGVAGGGPGTSANSTMAVLTFTATGEFCAQSDLVQFRSHTPGTRLTNNVGAAITATLNDLGSVSHDATDPVITCPSNVTVNADAGGCTASPSAALAGPWLTFGNAVVTNKAGGGDDLSLLLSAPAPGDFGVLRYTPPSPLLFNALTTLSASYNMQSGCFGCGSLAFYVRVDFDNNGQVSAGDRNVFVYAGAYPNFNDCPPLGSWLSTGNLITSPDLRFDTSGVGGTFYDSHAGAVALVGTKQVLRVTLVVDNGCGPGKSMLVDDVTVNGDVQRFNPLATDLCDTDVAITGVRSDLAPLTDPYPTGITTITWTATDDCGNDTTCVQTVTVNASNTLDVTVQLANVSAAPFDRCITFDVTNDCSPTTHHEVSTVITFTGGVGHTLVNVPCGNWTCITARDTRHTLRRTDSNDFAIDGVDYVADFTGADALQGGNLNDDNVIDILDFGALVGQYGQNVGASTTCATPYPHADISGNGTVFTEDYTFIANGFLNTHEPDCCGNLLVPATTRIAVVELLGSNPGLIGADLNHDGWLDTADMTVFAVNGGLPCRPDWDGNSAVQPADISQFVNTWFGALSSGNPQADFDGDGRVQPADIASFVNAWMGALGAGC